MPADTTTRALADMLLRELEQELATTRRFLERLPADKLGWRPHPRSLTAGQLALHIAMSPGAAELLLTQDSHEVPDFDSMFAQPGSVEEVLDTFDRNAAASRRILSEIDDALLATSWTWLSGGEAMMTMSRAEVVRSIVLNHTYHHRGQFGIYLRLLGARVPSAYGPSGDENPDGSPVA